MSADTPKDRAIWKAHLVAFLVPHLGGTAAERNSALNTVLTALDTAQSEGLRRAARLCREIAKRADGHRDAALARAESIEQMAAREDERSVEAARKWQNEP
jgi:hypothetical protein